MEIIVDDFDNNEIFIIYRDFDDHDN